MENTKKTVDDILEERAADELDDIDMDARYREMLDECYSLESVGGPFAHMSASSVLEEVDPVAYRCGFNDWIDGELRGNNSVEEIGDKYYDADEVEKLRETIEEEIAEQAEKDAA